jgi:hypothetical protein
MMAMLALCLGLALAAGDGLPDRLRVDEPRQDLERDRQQPAEADTARPPMEWLYWNSRLEGGMLWTDFDGDLGIETDFAFYVRWDVSITPNLSVNLTYRHYDFESSTPAGKEDEHLLIRGVFFGLGAHVPFATDFFFAANGALGVMRWESNRHEFRDETGPVLAGEAALGARLTEMLRIKAGIGLDLASTAFHEDSTQTQVNLHYLLGFELGF